MSFNIENGVWKGLKPAISVPVHVEDKLEHEMTSTRHTSQSSQMEFGSDSNLPYQFLYTFEDKLEDEMTSAKRATQTSKMELERDSSPPYPFRYTFEDKLAEEMIGATHASQSSEMEF